MGKSILSAVRLHELSRIVSSANGNAKSTTQKQAPRLPNSVAVPPKPGKMGTSEESKEGEQCRVPLSHVVADYANRWFLDALNEAKAGDASMQLLVAQMYYSGYGVPRDPQKVKFLFILCVSIVILAL